MQADYVTMVEENIAPSHILPKLTNAAVAGFFATAKLLVCYSLRLSPTVPKCSLHFFFQVFFGHALCPVQCMFGYDVIISS